MTAAAFLLAAAIAARAGDWQVRTAGVWTEPALGTVAADQTARLAGLSAAWTAAHGGTGPVGSAATARGTGLEWEAARALGSRGGVGIGAGWLAAPGLVATFRGTGDLLETSAVRETISASLSWLTAGCWLAGEPVQAVSGRLSLFAGPAWGSATFHRERTTTEGTTVASGSAAASASGAGLAAELAAEAGWEFASGLWLSARSGYRWARIPAMRFVADADLDGDGADEVKRDARLMTDSGAPLAFDFSGAYVSLGIRAPL